jgi:hypothetical protein
MSLLHLSLVRIGTGRTPGGSKMLRLGHGQKCRRPHGSNPVDANRTPLALDVRVLSARTRD